MEEYTPGKYIVDEIKRNAPIAAGIQKVVDLRRYLLEVNEEHPDSLLALGAAGAGLLAYLLWAAKVGTDNDWDHKTPIRESFGEWHQRKGSAYRYDIWSNIHYENFARWIVFENWEMFVGAGIAQIGDYLNPDPDVQGTLKPEWLNLTNFGDDPYDQAARKVAFALHAKVGDPAKLTYETFWKVFDNHADTLPRRSLENFSSQCAAWE